MAGILDAVKKATQQAGETQEPQVVVSDSQTLRTSSDSGK